MIVLDASVYSSYILNDETDKYSIKVIEKIKKDKLEVLIPSIFNFEIINVLGKACIRNRISEFEAKEFVKALKISKFKEVEIKDISEIISLSLKNNISSYDSLYLFLALKFDVKLATIDKKLKEVAENYNKFYKI